MHLWESQTSNTKGGLVPLSLLTFWVRKWYLSVPCWDVKKLLLFKAMLCRQPTGLHAGSQRGRSLWQCSEMHSTSVLRPQFAILWLCMLDRALLQTASSADCQERSSGEGGIKAFLFVSWKEVLQSQSSIWVVEGR